MPSFPSPERWTTRAQPWLGTLVEIALPPAEASAARFACAFSAIAHVHRKMSAHDPASDLARIARDAHWRPVVVDPDTFAVLELAQDLYRESDGAFDLAIAPLLARSGQLPAGAAGSATDCATMTALRLERGFSVRATVPVALDLSGIAKGHAVDRAIDALRAAGARTGMVNAGGDLRVFGAGTWLPIRVRHPASPALTRAIFDIRNAAVATSADYFRATQLVDPRTRSLRPFRDSITVVAPTCALADALTKIVALRPAESVAVLARHRAHAFVLGDDGAHCVTTCAESTAHLRLPVPIAP